MNEIKFEKKSGEKETKPNIQETIEIDEWGNAGNANFCSVNYLAWNSIRLISHRIEQSGSKMSRKYFTMYHH